jgi:hypothetical protein
MGGNCTTTEGAGPRGFKAGAAASYAILLIAVAAAPGVSPAVAARPQVTGSASIIELDRFGPRGRVSFNHDNHTTRQNPDPNAPFKTQKGASCSGCHHTLDPASGAPQLWKCAGCHRGSGDPKNPKGRDGDEQWSETAYHNLCIGCHVASKKGPVKCGDCHQFREGQR